MSQQKFSTQFITEIQGVNHFQQVNFEILNYTSLNFARPSKPTDSHTAFMTAERRKLLDQLPRLETNVIEDIPSRKSNVNSQNNASNAPNLITSQSPDHGKNEKVTPHVKFAIDSNQSTSTSHQHRRTLTEVDVTANPDNDSKRIEDNEDKPDNIDNRKKNRLNKKAYRRASAPAQGIDYYFKNAKQSKTNSYYYNNIKKNVNNLCIPSVHIETDEPVDDTESNDINHNQNTNSTSMSSSITSVSSNTSCNPPSLSPCSSNSSLSSSVDMSSPATIKQINFVQAYDNLANPLAMKLKSKIITDISFQSESQSLPDIVTSPYCEVPWSPAAMYLSNFAHSNVIRPLPDEEGQQIGDYIIGKVIGRGGFSTVKQAHAMDHYSGSMNTVAVKIVRNHIDSDNNDRIQALLEREISIWRRLDHPNILRMSSVEYDNYATFVFSEYCPGGTLLDYIKKHSKSEGKGIDEDEARNIFLEVAEAIRYLHNDMRLVHKDLKLDNILLDNEDTWKICDFGLTEFQNSANGFDGILYSDTVGGSIAYCAPEQLRCPTPIKDPSVDVWSLGVVLFAMVTGQLPFTDSFEPRLQLKIINGRYDESLLDDSGISDELRDLLRGMFKTKPEQRLTISQVLEHQWCER